MSVDNATSSVSSHHLIMGKSYDFFTFASKVIQPSQGWMFGLNTSADTGTLQFSAMTDICNVLASIYKLLHWQISIKFSVLVNHEASVWEKPSISHCF